MGIRGEDRLIVALDMTDINEAKEMVSKLDGVVSFFKVGIILYSSAGPELVDWIVKEKQKKVFLDLKFYDIGNTVKEAVKPVVARGVSFLTVHGNGAIMKGAVEGKGESDLKLFAVTVLTSLDEADLKDMGLDTTPESLVLHRAKKALEYGCDGVVASGREAAMIKEATGGKLLIMTPGIRPGDASVDDQKRIVTPSVAISAGADYLVVGRPITRAENPREAAENIVKEMNEAFEA